MCCNRFNAGRGCTIKREANTATGAALGEDPAAEFPAIGDEQALRELLAESVPQLRELVGRVKGLLRRLQTANAAGANCGARSGVKSGAAGVPRYVAFGRCVLDMDAGALLAADGREVRITPAELDLLSFFARWPNEPLSRDRIMEGAHRRAWDALDRSIDLRIMRLRRRIEVDPRRPRVLKTVRGVGYMFVQDTAPRP